jgi:ATP-dependent Lon protease
MSGRKRKPRPFNEQYVNYSRSEKYYFNRLDDDTKDVIAKREADIAAMNNRLVPLRFQILESCLDAKTRAVAIQKLDHIYGMDTSSGDYHKMLNWVETICKVPFGKYLPLSVSKDSSREEIKGFIAAIKETMDTKVFGHATAKDQIVRLLAQWISNPQAKGLVIGIQGSMGTGKTTLIKEAICKVLGLPFAMIPLGGVSDGSFLVGHSYTYEGSTWGRIVDMLIKCGCMNPVIFFDELDKVSTTRHGEEIINILIHMTDASQNETFNDKYFTGVDFDLSRSLIIFSYNDEDRVNPILRDRMVKIKTDGYKTSDKLVISQRHLVPEILGEFGFEAGQVCFSDSVVRHMIGLVEKEEGVRNLKRAIHDVVSNLNLGKLLENTLKFPIQVETKDADRFVNVGSKKDQHMQLAMYS